MTKRSTGARFNLGEPFDTMLAAYCEILHEANATRVMRDAVRLLIHTRLEKNDGLREDYEAEMRRLRGVSDSTVVVLVPKKD